jgi:hypothetical protein
MRWIALHEQCLSIAAVRFHRGGAMKGPFPSQHRFRARHCKYSIIAQNVIGRDNFKFCTHKVARAARRNPR